MCDDEVFLLFCLGEVQDLGMCYEFLFYFIFPLVFGVDKARLPGGLARIPPLFRFQQLVRAAFFF